MIINMEKKIIVGIETSCDDTCVGVLEITHGRPVILSNIKIKQNNLHEKYGGIVPEVAARSHISRLPYIFKEALELAHVPIKDVSLLTYTQKPGLLGSLLIGEHFTKGLALQYHIPVIGVHHLKAHGLSALMEVHISYPFLSLIISGGHTELWRFNSLNSYEILDKTADDAIGELFDKVGRVMGLPFPAGPQIEILAEDTEDTISSPLPKILSCSGLKTKFIRLLEEGIDKKIISARIQQVVSEMLIRTLSVHGAHHIPIIVGGGVAANKYIRRKLLENFKNIYFPPQELCTDNGIMIAWCGYLEFYS